MPYKNPTPDDDQGEGGPLGGTRAQSMHRLQVGMSLLVGIILIVGLANVIEQRATQSEQTAVPEAAATIAADPTTPANDPLADAGVVPDLPAENEAGTTAAPTSLPPADQIDNGT